MHRREKCLLEGFELHRNASGGVVMELAISIWQAPVHSPGDNIILRFVISPVEADELAVALAAAASEEVP